MELKLVKIFSHSSRSIQLFSNQHTGEGMILLRELVKFFHYPSLLSRMERDCSYQKGIHTSVLKGKALREFKSYLRENQNLDSFHRSTRLLFLHEAGLSLLLSKNCRQEIVLLGKWLLTNIFPFLRQQFPETYWATVFCPPLNYTFFVILHKGRFTFFEFQVRALLNLSPKEAYQYQEESMENLHWFFLPPSLLSKEEELPNFPSLNKDSFLLSESGVYRYLQKNKEKPSRWIGFMEKYLFSNLRRSEICWHKLHSQKTEQNDFLREKAKPLIFSNIRERKENKKIENSETWSQKLEKILAHQNEKNQDKILRETALITARIDGLIHFLEDRFPFLEKKLEFLCQQFDKTSLERSSHLVELKTIARELGVYYLDKKTPHIVFVKALIDWLGMRSSDAILITLENMFSLRPGENRIELPQNTYTIWKV